MAEYDLNYLEEMKRAEEGDLDAMFNVASYTIWGDLTSPVEPEAAERALKYYFANADAGDTDAMLDLGAMYAEGRGVEKDKESALFWYQKAAELDGYRACRCLGNMYKYDVVDDGTPVPTNDQERLQKALEWYELGTERNEENCIYELGDFYRYGIIVQKDEKKAFELYSEAYQVCCYIMEDHYMINDSYSDVCFRLAECYHYGIGTKIDMDKARFYSSIAKDEAKRRLDNGDMYGGYLYPAALKEWQSIIVETGF